jgi:Ni,Fe-hydrogenase maturation factor
MKIAAAAFLLTAAAPAPDPPKLDMLGFFTGKTHADNIIRIALHAPHKLIVDSVGGHNKEGEFVLIDTVREEGKPVRTRTWVMHPLGPDHFTGVLSDAIGPVDVVVHGDSAAISYVMKDGHLRILQEIKIETDGRILSNHVVAKKFGLTFAQVDGTIRKVD